MSEKQHTKRVAQAWSVPHESFSVRIRSDLLRKLEKLSRREKLSRNQCISEAIEEWTRKKLETAAKAA